MRAHRQRPSTYRAVRIARAGGSSIGRHRLARAAVLAATLVLSSGTTLAVLPPPAAAEECPNAAFRTGPSTHLPDCRAYELVTPPYKASGRFGGQLYAINPSGSSMLLDLTAAVGGAEGFPNILGFTQGIVYTTRRTASGWVSVPNDPPTSEYLPYLSRGFSNYGGGGGESSDGQATVWMERGVWQPENELDFFMRNPDRSLVDIGPALPPTAPSESPRDLGGTAELHKAGLSPDASRYFFYIEQNEYWPFDETIRGPVPIPSLYEYLGSGNTTPLLVGVDNEGRLISRCGVVLGGSNSSHNAVSTDGNTVFFTARPAGYEACKGSGPPVEELFARVDNGLPGAHTVAISEPSREDCAGCDTEEKVLANAHFEGASADGSKAFFTTKQPLLGGDTSTNIYEYDFNAPAGERVIRVSAGDSTVSNPAAEVVQINEGRSPMSSEDGSHVYFIANGLLTRTPNGEGEAAEKGAENLYAFERDAQFPAGRIAFVAGLSKRDVSTSFNQISDSLSGLLWSPDVTPDGGFLVFASDRDLTPDDTSTARQIFEYDAQTGSLVRVSIGQDGFNHDGNVSARFYRSGEAENDASIVSPSSDWGSEYDPSAYSTALSVSADGSYVFFQSTVGLTPQALNQQVIAQTENGEPIYANNVYEYHAGRVSLISDGQDIAHSGGASVVELLGGDMSGGDVFFTTADRLVGQDTDTNVDIYDARIDGGFPAPAQPFSCSGEACQGPLSAAPTLLSPGSELQAGGNPPLAGEPAAKPKQKKAKKQKPKKRGASTGRGHAKRRGGKARKAAAGSGANRKGVGHGE
jgi:hypothetical protein